MLLHIRNMESSRCKTVVKNELNKLGLSYTKIELGEVVLKDNITNDTLHQIDLALRNAGLELIENKNVRLVENIKAAIIQLVNLSDEFSKPNSSDYISMKVKCDYTHLSKIFSSSQGITIEKFIIEQKIEKLKELLVYSKLSLGDIAYKLQYSSVAHLSNQFKKITGLTPSFFKILRKTHCK